MRKPKAQTAVLKFLANNPFSPAIVVQRGVNMRKGNIYSVLSRLVEKGNVVKQGKFYRLSESYDRATKIIKSIEDERMPL